MAVSYSTRKPTLSEGLAGDLVIYESPSAGYYLYARGKRGWKQTSKLRNISSNIKLSNTIFDSFTMKGNINLGGYNIAGNNVLNQGITIDKGNNKVSILSSEGLQVNHHIIMTKAGHSKIYLASTKLDSISSEKSGSIDFVVSKDISTKASEGMLRLQSSSMAGWDKSGVVIPYLNSLIFSGTESLDEDSGNASDDTVYMVRSGSSGLVGNNIEFYNEDKHTLTVGLSTTNTGQINLYETKPVGTHHSIGLKAAAVMAANTVYTLPDAFPTSTSKVLQSTTAGVLSWVSDVGAITALNNATANELVTVGATTTELDAEANLTFDGTDLAIAATGKIYLDGGTHTSIYEASDDVLRIDVGGDTIIQLSEKGDDGNEVHFGSSCAGFTQLEPTYDATNTEVDFRHSNKQNLTFGGANITNLKITFPSVSGNFVLLIKQDGIGSRTITNYRVYEFDETTADGELAVKFAGGSNPTLTTDANHVDILSFYWDADNEIAYGVATLDFQF